MSTRTLRNILAGSALATVLSLGSPVACEAGSLAVFPEARLFWVHAWEWLTGEAAAAPDDSAGEPLAAEVEEVRSVSDAGWTIDPDG